MNLSPSLLAKAMLEYFQQEDRNNDFEDFLYNNYKVDNTTIKWKGDKENKRILLLVTTVDPGRPGVLYQTYALKIDKLEEELR